MCRQEIGILFGSFSAASASDGLLCQLHSWDLEAASIRPEKTGAAVARMAAATNAGVAAEDPEEEVWSKTKAAGTTASQRDEVHIAPPQQ